MTPSCGLMLEMYAIVSGDPWRERYERRALNVSQHVDQTVRVDSQIIEFLNRSEFQMSNASCHGRVGLRCVLHGSKGGSTQSFEATLAVGPATWINPA